MARSYQIVDPRPAAIAVLTVDVEAELDEGFADDLATSLNMPVITLLGGDSLQFLTDADLLPYGFMKIPK